jgi:hypothetical protein
MRCRRKNNYARQRPIEERDKALMRVPVRRRATEYDGTHARRVGHQSKTSTVPFRLGGSAARVDRALGIGASALAAASSHVLASGLVGHFDFWRMTGCAVGVHRGMSACHCRVRSQPGAR